MNDLKTLIPCELSHCAREIPKSALEDLYSFPDGFCFLYALAYRLGMFGHSVIVTQDFPDVTSVKKWLAKKRKQVATRDLDQFDSLMSSKRNSYELKDDGLLFMTFLCSCELGSYTSMVSLFLTSDLWAVLDGTLWHIYYNPLGDKRRALIGYDVPYTFGGKPGKSKPPRVKKIYVEKVQQPQPKPQRPQKKPKKVKQITPAGQLLRRVGAIAGGFLGNESLGKSLGAGISRIFGQGDYVVKSNTLMNSGPPSFSPLNSGIRITHREYITDILSSTAYQVRTYRLQPSISSSFPWLSQLANSFEQYKVNGMVVYLNTTSGNAVSSTNNALGVWGVTTVYDPTRPPLANKLLAEEYVGCTSGVPACSIMHPVECKPKSDVLERYYVDYTQNVTGDSLKFYDHGLINVFTQGQQAASINLGEMWIAYDITFYNPRVQPVAELNVADHYGISGSAITATNPMGTTPVLSPNAGSGIGTTITTGGSGFATLNLPANTSTGTYIVAYLYNGGNTVANFAFSIASLSSNVSLINFFSTDTSNFYAAPVPGSVTVSSFAVCVAFTKTDNNAASIRLGSSSNVMPAGSASTFVDLLVIPIGAVTAIKSLSESKKEDLYALIEHYLSTRDVIIPIKEQPQEDSSEFLE